MIAKQSLKRMTTLPAIAGVLALSLGVASPVNAADKMYTGPLFDGHGHIWPMVEPPLTVAGFGAMLKEIGVDAAYVQNIDYYSFISPGGAEEGARIARKLFPNSLYPFVAIELGEGPPFDNMIKWINQDPVFIDEQVAKMDRLLSEGLAFGIGEIYTQWGEYLTISGPTIPADSPGLMKLAELARKHDVPLQIHHTIIPVGDEDKGSRLDDWDRLLDSNPDTKFLMAHAGFTPSWLADAGPNGGPARIRGWIERHPKFYVEFAWAAQSEYLKRGLVFTNLPANPDAIAPITTDGTTLTPEWRQLFEDHPDRFIAWGSDPTFNFAADIKTPAKSLDQLLGVVKLAVRSTREILGQLPPDIAIMIAYKNAYSLMAK